MTRANQGSVRRIARLTAPAIAQTGRFVLDADAVLICVADPPLIRPPQIAGWPGVLTPTVARHPLAVGSSDAIVFLDGAEIDILPLGETDAAYESDRLQRPGERPGIGLVEADGGWDLYAGDVSALQQSWPRATYTLTGEGPVWVALSHALARWENDRWLIVPTGLGPPTPDGCADPDQTDQRSRSARRAASCRPFAQHGHCA